MIKIIDAPEKQDRIIKMSEMKPMQVGQMANGSPNEGHYVMRSVSMDHFEVMDLTDRSCWSGHNRYTYNVRLLDPSESITIELYNED